MHASSWAYRFVLGLSTVALGACAEGTEAPGTGGTASSAGGTSATGAGGQGGEPAGAGAQGGSPSQGGQSQGGTTGDGGAGGEIAHGGSGPGPIEQACPDNQFATGFDGSGVIQCAALDPAVPPAVNAGCDIFFGARDNCGACSTEPAKWGRVSGAACANGAGADDTCASAVIGGQTVGMFGLNLDGDVDDNDKLYAGFSCDAGVAGEGPGPCDAGEVVVAYDGASTTCASAGAAALDYVRGSCSLYLGWRDSCDGCTLAPSKWGFASSTGCNVGSGAGNTCVNTILGADTVPLLGIDLDGDVNEDDKLYVGLHCAAPAPSTGSQSDTCPSGQFVTGTHGDGTIECGSPLPAIAQYVDAHCTVYFGWRDTCDGCTTMPTKYGRVREGFCSSDAGVNDSCIVSNLAGQTVSLLGLNTDGNVNDDDKLYIGLLCD